MSNKMKAFVITLKNDLYSNQVAGRCITTAAKHGLTVEKFDAIDKHHAEQCMLDYGLIWTWPTTKEIMCEKTGLRMHLYPTADLRNRIGCSMSHYLLWQKCVELDEPVLILEHDAVFISDWPNDIKFNGICMINDPAGATPRGGWWSDQIKSRGTIGVHSKTWIREEHERHIPDGLAGGSAYLIKPWAAQEVINKFHEIGVWPNDATICQQLFPYLEEYYPFITKPQQSKSTTSH